MVFILLRKMPILCLYTDPAFKPKDTTLWCTARQLCRPIAFTAYSSTLETIVHKIKESNGSDSTDSIILNGFVDDHSLSKAFCPDINEAEENTIRILEHSLFDISHWMATNRLKMNPTKTDFIYLGSRVQVGKCLEETISVCGDSIECSEVVQLLDVHIDKHLSFKYHIGFKCKTAMYNQLRIKHISRHLTQEVAQILVSSLVMSHLDYANSLLYGLPACDIDKLQCVQNCAAKLVLNRSKYDSRTQAFIDLHWLPIQACIDNKILTLVYNCLNQEALKYLMDMLKQKVSIKNGLRSNNLHNLLEMPKVSRKTFAARSFSYLGPTLWNDLLDNLRTIQNAETFRKKLKTYLF